MAQGTANNTNIFQIIPTNYPNTLLIGTKSYPLSFNITNNSANEEKFRLEFIGEGLNAEVPKEIENPIVLKANQTISFSVKIKPLKNGQAKIIINTIHLKVVQYIDKVWVVRDNISEDIVKEALFQQYYTPQPLIEFDEIRLPDKLAHKLGDISMKEAERQVSALLNPPEKNMNVLKDPITGVILSSTPIEKIPELSQDEKNKRFAEIARKVFNNDMDYAFQVIGNIIDLELDQKLLLEFILPYSVKEPKKAIEKMDLILDPNIKDQILEQYIKSIFKRMPEESIKLTEKIFNQDKKDELNKIIICNLAKKNISQAMAILNKINNLNLKQELLLCLIGIYLRQNIDEAYNLVDSLQDINLQFAITYEIIKQLYNINKQKCLKIVNDLIEKSKKYANIGLLKYAIVFLAKINNPKTAVEYINNLPDAFKNAIHSDLYSKLWELKETPVNRVDQIPISSVYYTFNTIVQPNKPIEMVHDLGGNISENLLSGDFSSFIGIICPFGFPFPIFPPIEQSYAHIKSEKSKSFYYMIIPTKFKTEEEFIFIQTLLNMWFVSNEANFKSKVYLFNIDFIPYLSKPTIIMESEPEENLLIKSIVDRVFKDSISFIIDDGLFKGGMVKNILQSILPSHRFKVINMVLTYDFLNNYILFKNFMSEFIK